MLFAHDDEPPSTLASEKTRSGYEPSHMLRDFIARKGKVPIMGSCVKDESHA